MPSRAVTVRLPWCAMSIPHLDAHRTGGAFDHPHRGLYGVAVQVLHLPLGDFLDLRLGDLPGLVAPDSSFAAFLRKNDTGGVRISKVKERSAKMVMTTGIGAPFSSFWVWALKALQNSMMLRARWPSEGPLGGDGIEAH